MYRLGEFQKVINSYSHIAMARRKLDGSLRGMILVKVEQSEREGRRFNLMTVSKTLKSCTFIDHYCINQRIQLAIAYCLKLVVIELWLGIIEC